MAKEYHIIKKNKNKIPSKKVMNLYYKEDTTTRPSTIALYVLFILVALLAVGKVAVYDLAVKLEDEQAKLAYNQSLLDAQTEYLADYKDVSSQYSRYSYSYLTQEEKVCDRMDILSMLEATLFYKAKLDSVMITDDIVTVSFRGLNLEEAAGVAGKIETYDIVEKVVVNTASLNDSVAEEGKDALVTRMVITLVSEEAEEQEVN